MNIHGFTPIEEAKVKHLAGALDMVQKAMEIAAVTTPASDYVSNVNRAFRALDHTPTREEQLYAAIVESANRLREGFAAEALTILEGAMRK